MEKSNMITELMDDCLKIQKEKKRSKENGDFFNIFKILGLSTNEVRTHSAFISELLDPDGSHGQGNLFLVKFLENVSQEISPFKISDLVTATVTKEKYISRIDNDYTEGGSIDILIEIETRSKQTKVIKIENKIYARDQKNQLLRYHKYKKNSTIALFYLTLFGTSPDNNSIGNKEKVYYKVISYKDTIKSWLDDCIESFDNKQIIWNSINQYSKLIDMLIMNDQDMVETMKFLKKDKQNLELAKEIKIAYEKLIINKVEEFKNEFQFGTKRQFYFFSESNEKKNFEHAKFIFKYSFGQDFCFFYQFYAYEKQKDEKEKNISPDISEYMKNLLINEIDAEFDIKTGSGLGWRSPSNFINIKLEDSDLIFDAIVDVEKSNKIIKEIYLQFETDMQKFINAINESHKINSVSANLIS